MPVDSASTRVLERRPPSAPGHEPAGAPDFRTRWDAYRGLLTSHLADLAREWQLRLLSEMFGNIGDHLIWDGTDDVFAAAGVHFNRVPRAAIPEMTVRDARHACLVIPGNAAFTAIWNEWLPALTAQAADRFARVVILPSQFDPAVPVVAEALARPNVFAFAREPASYARIRRFGRAALAFDPALYSRRLPGLDAPAEAARGEPRRLVALREDPESLLAVHGCRPDPRVNRDISRLAGTLDEFLAEIRAVDEVVTDRMHVAVAAVMTGRRLRYIDPHNRKISTYFAFVFRDELADRARPCTVDWLLEHGFVTREA